MVRLLVHLTGRRWRYRSCFLPPLVHRFRVPGERVLVFILKPWSLSTCHAIVMTPHWIYDPNDATPSLRFSYPRRDWLVLGYLRERRPPLWSRGPRR
jgi:hypothetical protein